MAKIPENLRKRSQLSLYVSEEDKSLLERVGESFPDAPSLSAAVINALVEWESGSGMRGMSESLRARLDAVGKALPEGTPRELRTAVTGEQIAREITKLLSTLMLAPRLAIGRETTEDERDAAAFVNDVAGMVLCGVGRALLPASFSPEDLVMVSFRVSNIASALLRKQDSEQEARLRHLACVMGLASSTDISDYPEGRLDHLSGREDTRTATKESDRHEEEI